MAGANTWQEVRILPFPDHEATLSAMNEFELIEHYFRGWRGSHPDLILGQGDDCLIWHPRRATVMSIDTAVEGRHFPVQSTGAQAAQRAFLPALSDLAAMGADPAFFTLALTLPSPMDDAWLDDFARRLRELSEHYGLVLAGGDTTSGPCRVISMQMHGLVDAPLRRDGVQPDDDLWVSGFPGRAGAALPAVLNPARTSVPEDWLTAYWSPQPRIELGQRLVGLVDWLPDADAARLPSCSAAPARANVCRNRPTGSTAPSISDARSRASAGMTATASIVSSSSGTRSGAQCATPSLMRWT